MDANSVFATLLRSIEDSQLNYSINKTPFSATISLKGSFVKRFSESCQMSEHRNVVNLISKDFQNVQKEMKDDTLKLHPEVDELKKDFENDQKKLLDNLVKLQQSYDEEKDRSNSLELKNAEFRDEVVKLKKEKKKLQTSLNLQKESCEGLEEKAKHLIEEIKALQVEVTAKTAERVPLGSLLVSNERKDECMHE